MRRSVEKEAYSDRSLPTVARQACTAAEWQKCGQQGVRTEAKVGQIPQEPSEREALVGALPGARELQGGRTEHRPVQHCRGPRPQGCVGRGIKQQQPQRRGRKAASTQLQGEHGGSPVPEQRETVHGGEHVRSQALPAAAGRHESVHHLAWQRQLQPKAAAAELLHAARCQIGRAALGHHVHGLLYQLKPGGERHGLRRLAAPARRDVRPEPQQPHRLLAAEEARAEGRQQPPRGLLPQLPALPPLSQGAESLEAGGWGSSEGDRAQELLGVGRPVEVVDRPEGAEVSGRARRAAPPCRPPQHRNQRGDGTVAHTFMFTRFLEEEPKCGSNPNG
mmetsp:Transcript_3694/g.11905  ORF Transcript_3694/g.11905 Transcript_3694/m.11905 type:complete len:334 (+) Transcript_3694:268-1269(+)